MHKSSYVCNIQLFKVIFICSGSVHMSFLVHNFYYFKCLRITRMAQQSAHSFPNLVSWVVSISACYGVRKNSGNRSTQLYWIWQVLQIPYLDIRKSYRRPGRRTCHIIILIIVYWFTLAHQGSTSYVWDLGKS